MPDALPPAAAEAVRPRGARCTTWCNAVEIERADVQLATIRRCASARRASELSRPDAAGEQDTDVLGFESSRGVRERRRRRRVEPLDVVDCDKKVTGARKSSESVEQRDASRVRIGRRALDLLEDERTRERRALTSGKGASASSRTGSRRSPRPEKLRAVSLSAGCGLQDAQPRRLCRLDSGAPERRLPHPGLALENQRRRSVGDAGDEVPDGRKLGVPPYDHSGHGPPIVRLRRYCRHGVHDLPRVRARLGAARRRQREGRLPSLRLDDAVAREHLALSARRARQAPCRQGAGGGLRRPRRHADSRSRRAARATRARARQRARRPAGNEPPAAQRGRRGARPLHLRRAAGSSAGADFFDDVPD